MPEVIPTSVWQGSFRLFGVDVKCHVLDNGQRIIEAESLNRLCKVSEVLGSLETTSRAVIDKIDDAELQAFVRWQNEGICPKK